MANISLFVCTGWSVFLLLAYVMYFFYDKAEILSI